MATAEKPQAKSKLSDIEVDEISLVDHPCVPKAKFEIAKRMTEPADNTTGAETVEKTDELTDANEAVAVVEANETTQESVEVAKEMTDDGFRKALIEIGKYCERENAKASQVNPVGKSDSESDNNSPDLSAPKTTQAAVVPSLIEQTNRLLQKRKLEAASNVEQQLFSKLNEVSEQLSGIAKQTAELNERVNRETGR